MLKDLTTVAEIKQFFADLDKKPMADMQKARIYEMAKAYQDISEREKLVRDYYENRRDRVQEVYFISDQIQIAEVERNIGGERKVYFEPFVNGRKHTEISESFDYALLLALASKYNSNGAAYFIAKMLGMVKE